MSDEPDRPIIDSRRWTGDPEPSRAQKPPSPPAQQVAQTKPRTLLLLFVVLVGGSLVWIVASFVPNRNFPACDDGKARTALAKLYDNRRLLHAAEVSTYRHLQDGVYVRYCSVSVKWSDGSESDVRYDFYRSSPGRRNRNYVYMWIEYNGGMRGPLF